MVLLATEILKVEGRPRTRLMPIELKIAEAWLTAGADLGIQLDVDGQVGAEDGSRIAYAVRIPFFGRRLGTVCRHRDAPEAELSRLAEWARSANLDFTKLGDPYSTYERDLFSETLDDWQWFGEGDPPRWYNGKPWP